VIAFQVAHTGLSTSNHYGFRLNQAVCTCLCDGKLCRRLCRELFKRSRLGWSSTLQWKKNFLVSGFLWVTSYVEQF